MTRTQEPPPSAKPSGAFLDTTAISVTPAGAFPTTKPAAINIRNIGGKPHYQAFIPGQKSLTYVDATTGRENPEADANYAREIAAGFLSSDKVKRTDYNSPPSTANTSASSESFPFTDTTSTMAKAHGSMSPRSPVPSPATRMMRSSSRRPYSPTSTSSDLSPIRMSGTGR